MVVLPFTRFDWMLMRIRKHLNITLETFFIFTRLHYLTKKLIKNKLGFGERTVRVKLELTDFSKFKKLLYGSEYSTT